MNNLDMMRKRLMMQGGVEQENRMIKGKLRTLQQALKYSYQACTVQKVQPYSDVLPINSLALDCGQPVRALINPDKVKQDYDDKILSIEYTHNFVPGDVFEWKKTDTYWIVYLQEITEDAYFRGEIRRCRYRIKFKDNNGNWCSTWAAIRGPVETQVDSIQKNQERIDRPNLSLNILMPRNDKTLLAFDRYSEFLFAGRCWRVEAPDSISMKNIIEVSAEEDYINTDTDDLDNELKNGLVIERVMPPSAIQGEGLIIPLVPEVYTIDRQGGKWCVSGDGPVTLRNKTDNSVELTWEKMTRGEFVLKWSKGNEHAEKHIKVNSLY